MPEAVTPAAPDLIESLLGVTPESPLGVLRRRRPEALRHAEGAFRELLLPSEPGGLSLAERAALALLVADREGAAGLAERFRAMRPEGTASPRLDALLAYAEKVALTPEATGKADIDAMDSLGLSERDIVAATQLIAFVPYQIRLLAALSAMQGEPGAEPLPANFRQDGRAPLRFTMKAVGWRPRIAPVKPESATPDQLAALEACPPAQRRSTYFLTLAHDPASLGERGALFNIVMYAEGGLPRAERELATAVVSMVNGCVYCTAVHAKRFVELSGDEAPMQRLLDHGWSAEPDPRRRAIAEFTEVLTRDPSLLRPAHLAPLRAAGLDDLDLLDLFHSVAMFANANRLMLTLGDPLLPQAM